MLVIYWVKEGQSTADYTQNCETKTLMEQKYSTFGIYYGLILFCK